MRRDSKGESILFRMTPDSIKDKEVRKEMTEAHSQHKTSRSFMVGKLVNSASGTQPRQAKQGHQSAQDGQ